LEHITVKARAKINPFLDILYKRPDGYHELRTVMQSLLLHDTVMIKKVSKYPLRLICEPEGLPTDERNLVYRAAAYMITEFNLKQGMFIKLTKRIPVSAGLGGGSADCAAALIGINKLYSLGLSTRQLVEIGGTFGADVPFCVMGGTVLAEGVGEICTTLPPHPSCYVLLAKLPVSVSTASVFGAWAESCTAERDDNRIEAFLEAVKNQNLKEISNNFYNALLPVTAAMHPDIDALIETLRRTGALGASMSGSGPTVFGYFQSKDAASAAMKAVREEHPTVKEIYITSIINNVLTKGR
jgi:4-diphosphocytidyl-2-C-methyl-D-erythritol kinase